jgi:uncharacterized protein (TIGR02265 family)
MQTCTGDMKKSRDQPPQYQPPQYREAVATLSPYCDIKERLALVPASAQMRGLYFRSVEDEVKKYGDIHKFLEMVRANGQDTKQAPRSHLKWYSASEYLVWIAAAAYLIEGAGTQNVRRGLERLGRAYSAAFTETILGRTLLRVLSRDPFRVAQQGIAGRRQSATFGQWQLSRTSERSLEMSYDNEYVWIESVVTGAAMGTYQALGIEITMTTELAHQFKGSTIVRW